MALKAAVFDLDGTVYPYSRLISTSVSLTLRYPRFFAHFSQVRIAIRRMRPIEDFRKLQAELLARSMRIPPEWAGRLIQEIIYERLEDRFRQIRPFPNLLETLADLKAMGFKLAILSDFPVRRKLQYLGLDGVWDLAACSEETHYLKPNPEPFLAVAGRLSIPPGEILFVGDKYHYDILGAHRVGMRTAHLTRNPHGRSVADLSFRTYRDFSSRVQQIGAVTDSPNPSH